MQIDDIVQISRHDEPSVVGLLLQVDEVTREFVLGFCIIPYKGRAFFKIPKADVELIGQAMIGFPDEEIKNA